MADQRRAGEHSSHFFGCGCADRTSRCFYDRTTRQRGWPWNTRAYRWIYKHIIEPNATW